MANEVPPRGRLEEYGIEAYTYRHSELASLAAARIALPASTDAEFNNPGFSALLWNTPNKGKTISRCRHAGAETNACHIERGHMNLPSIYLFTAVLLSACAHHPAEWPIAFLGDSAPTSAATKTIVVQPETKWVNVTGGEIVAFAVGDKRFAWAFNVAAGVKSFDLRRVAPPGTLDRPVETYVAPDPRYIGGDGDSHDGGG